MSIQGSLAVMRNAFSTASVGAKIPDGAVSFSLTERLATAAQETSPNGILTFALTPSLIDHYQVARNKSTAAQVGPPAVAATEITFDNSPTTLHEGDASSKTSANIDRFRLVSGALRLTCINGSETLNGWFEAIRVNCEYADSNVNSDGHIAIAGIEDAIVSSTNWAQSPSYVTGRLRDIGKHTFYLKNINNHEFIPTNDARKGLDPNYDIVLVRIHSIAVPGTGAAAEAQQTAVHVHVVKNWELVYDAKSALSRYHTSCPVWKAGVENVKKAMARDPKASMIRAASAYAYR
jgi:hypothetical protein